MKTKSLPCELTHEELTRVGKELSQRVRELDELRTTHKANKSAMKVQEDEVHKAIALLARKRDSGEESRQVEVIERTDLRHRVVETVRTDTFQVVDTRGMTANEIRDAQQTSLPLVMAPAEGTKGTGKAKGKAKAEPASKENSTAGAPSKTGGKAKKKTASKKTTGKKKTASKKKAASKTAEKKKRTGSAAPRKKTRSKRSSFAPVIPSSPSGPVDHGGKVVSLSEARSNAASE